MVPPSSVEGGEVTEVSGGGVVGHSAGGWIPPSSNNKRVPQINETGSAMNIQTQWSADINIINYSLDIMFQCEGCLGHLSFTGHGVNAPAAGSPKEEGGVGGGLEPGGVPGSPHTQPGVQQLPAG